MARESRTPPYRRGQRPQRRPASRSGCRPRVGAPVATPRAGPPGQMTAPSSPRRHPARDQRLGHQAGVMRRALQIGVQHQIIRHPNHHARVSVSAAEAGKRRQSKAKGICKCAWSWCQDSGAAVSHKAAECPAPPCDRICHPVGSRAGQSISHGQAFAPPPAGSAARRGGRQSRAPAPAPARAP